MKNNKIKVYTDGGCDGTPGRGGWACIIHVPDEPEVVLSGGMDITTNNRMEIMAVLEALRHLQGYTDDIIIYSDSKYVVNSINEWLAGWVKKNFEGKKNADLWQRIWEYKQANPKIRAWWVKGHNGHEENERCDELATNVIYQMNLPIDKVCAENYGR